MSTTETHEERHASWLELFFDLVAVAGIGMLAHLLEVDDSDSGLAVYVIAFTAIWMIWACFTTYSNLNADTTFVAVILVGMSALGVMIAAVPEIRGEHATAFAVAYVVGRFVVARPWRRATVVVDLPIIQTSFGVVPWIVSWWFEGTAQYTLWAVGLALDLLMLLTTNRDRLLADTQARLDRMLEARSGRPHNPRHDRDHGDREIPTTIEAAETDVPHLTERLGLFVLIVIGEGLVQIIDGASEAEWNRALAVTGAGAFALMFGFWAAAVRWGYAGIALLPEQGLSPRLSWPAHLVATLALATVAAVLGGVVAAPSEQMSDHVRLLVVAAYVGYAVLSAGIHLARTAYVVAACVGVPMLVAGALVALLPDLDDQRAVWLLAAGIFGVLVAHDRTSRRDVAPA
ncbi:low temperature requirement protein A [Nocardioides sp. CN2-186]|uniref:low temperature requirement protein A n=1 Tax=Nocardioides tweenelious TaxID=3156607 RepID=UPI0032B3D809